MRRPGQQATPWPPTAAAADTARRGRSWARCRGLAAASAPRYDAGVVTRHATRSFYHLGALGSVMEITDMNEAEVVSYRYDPYGAVTITVGGTPQGSDPLGNPWMYTGRFSDEETGLYYYRARYYSATTGRFCERDPLGVAVGPSLYEYCSGSPSTLVDPDGLEEQYAPAEVKDIASAVHAAVTHEASIVVNPAVFGIKGQPSKADARDMAKMPYPDDDSRLASGPRSESYTLTWVGEERQRTVAHVQCNPRGCDRYGNGGDCDDYKLIETYHYEYTIVTVRGRGKRPKGDIDEIYGALAEQVGSNAIGVVAPLPVLGYTVIGAIHDAGNYPEHLRSMVVPYWGAWVSYPSPRKKAGVATHIEHCVKGCDDALKAEGQKKAGAGSAGGGLGESWCEWFKKGAGGGLGKPK